MTTYTDEYGNELTYEELRKILRTRPHPQFNWWKPKAQLKTGQGQPPPGVRQNVKISRL